MPNSIIRTNWSAPYVSGTEQYQKDFIASGHFYPSQQSFLGASITSFSISAGDGSTASSLNVNLVEDGGFKGNKDDDDKPIDPYHPINAGDSFSPPGVGMPVFFVYSNPPMKIVDAFAGNEEYGTSTFTFGGILSSFHRTRSTGGRTFSATITDPREILTNTYLILNHTDNKVGLKEYNIFNVFGFLENNISENVKSTFEDYVDNKLSRSTNDEGLVNWKGDDMYHSSASSIGDGYFENGGYSIKFPITGTGMSRRSSSGIPFYRIMQALAAMSNALPGEPEEEEGEEEESSQSSSTSEYTGFGNDIFYRGLYYEINFVNFPELSPFYHFDHDKIDLLSFLLEVAESTATEISVSLSPKEGTRVGGIINVKFIDRSKEVSVGSISRFINRLTDVQKDDIGFENADPVTSRVIFGANRVDLYAFTSNQDPHFYGGPLDQDHQILPFYGTISDGVMTPTKGDGAYRQIMLDSTGLGAYGVGNYYIATEAELRYASKSFEAWKSFLVFFNRKYIEKMTNTPKVRYEDIFTGNNGDLKITDGDGQSDRGLKVPRSLFVGDNIGQCCPKYGYPLYWGRATAIGLSLEDVVDNRYTVIADLNNLSGSSPDYIMAVRNAMLEKYERLGSVRRLTAAELDLIKTLRDKNFDKEYLGKAAAALQSQVQTGSKQESRKENSSKVYNFVRRIATEYYGKKWLVRIPGKPNFDFEEEVTKAGNKYVSGPFGFPPREASSTADKEAITGEAGDGFFNFVKSSNQPTVTEEQSKFYPCLTSEYNPVDDQLQHNFLPDSNGGFFTRTAYDRAVSNALSPRDLSTFGASHRIQAYVRYDCMEKLSAGTNKIYTEQIGDHRKKYIPSKTLRSNGIDATPSGGALLGFMPVDLDERYYFFPRMKPHSVRVSANDFTKVSKYIPAPIVPDASGKLNEEAGTVKKIILVEPVKRATGGTVEIDDVPRVSGVMVGMPDRRRAFALITLPEKVTAKLEKISDIPIFKSYPPATYLGMPGFEDSELNTHTETKIHKRLDLNNYGEGMTFYNPTKLFSAPRGLKPDVVVLPLRNEQACYGPYHNGPIKTKDDNDQDVWLEVKNLGGKVELENDSGLAPWNYGSYGLMDFVGKSRAELSATLYLASEKGSVTFPGMPSGNFTIGDVVEAAGPCIDSINLDIGVGGVTTGYKFQTYKKSYGNLKKQQQKMLDIVTRQALKGSEAQFELGMKGITKNKFKGKMPKPDVKPYESFYESPSYPHDMQVSAMIPSVDSSDPRKPPSEFTPQASSMSSKQTQDFLDSQDDPSQIERDRYLSAQSSASDNNVAISMEAHSVLPSVEPPDQYAMEDIFTQPTDAYDIESFDITYWS